MNLAPCLLAVFAHPDDEGFSGGALAHYAQQGYKVVLACATRGEAGQVKDASLGKVTDLGALREQELRKACQILGIEPPVFLGYHDSGRKERTQLENPQALMNADWLAIEQSLRSLIAELQPEVIVTFDPHGGYGHIDHLVVQRAALQAFFSSGHLPRPPKRLFYRVIPSATMQRMRENPRMKGLLGSLPPELFAVETNTIALSLNVSNHLETKLAATAAHVSQFATVSDPPPPEVAALMREMQSVEHYAIGALRGVLPTWPLSDMFEGL